MAHRSVDRACGAIQDAAQWRDRGIEIGEVKDIVETDARPHRHMFEERMLPGERHVHCAKPGHIGIASRRESNRRRDPAEALKLGCGKQAVLDEPSEAREPQPAMPSPVGWGAEALFTRTERPPNFDLANSIIAHPPSRRVCAELSPVT